MRGRAGTPRLLREINDRAALNLLLTHATLTRGQLVAATGLSKPTASQLLARLQEAGLVTVVGSTSGGRGPTAQVYGLDPRAGTALALDVTPAATTAAVADITGAVVATAAGDIDMHRCSDPAGAVLDVVRRAARSAKVPLRALDAVVIGSPGVYDETRGVLRHAEHMPAWARPGVLEDLAARLPVRPVVENDVNAAAVAERVHGVAVDASSVALLWLGTGLGLAIDLAGRVHRGATGGAGEVGYMPLPGFDRTGRGRRPEDFQSLVREAAVLALARRHGLRHRSAAGAVAAAAADPHRHAQFLSELATRVATGLAVIVTVLDPELVVLAGSTATAGGEVLRAEIQHRLHSLSPLRPAVAVSAVDGNPVIDGCLHLGLTAVRDELFRSSRQRKRGTGS